MTGISWEKTTEEAFNKIIDKVPVFLRDTAREKVSRRAELFARESGGGKVTEADMVRAFFKETPGGFWGPLQVDMESIGLDYTKYGIDRV